MSSSMLAPRSGAPSSRCYCSGSPQESHDGFLAEQPFQLALSLGSTTFLAASSPMECLCISSASLAATDSTGAPDALCGRDLSCNNPAVFYTCTAAGKGVQAAWARPLFNHGRHDASLPQEAAAASVGTLLLPSACGSSPSSRSCRPPRVERRRFARWPYFVKGSRASTPGWYWRRLQCGQDNVAFGLQAVKRAAQMCRASKLQGWPRSAMHHVT